MLPEHTLSDPAVLGKFIYPTGIAKHPLEYYERGGIAIQDASQGLRYQAWRGYYDQITEEVRLKGLTTEVETVLFTQEDVVELAFCFDQNMRWATVVKLLDGTVEFRWFDTVPGAYVTTTYPDSYLSPKLTLDDKRPLEVLHNDMLLTYIREGKLYLREQRDRFGVEYLLYENIPNNTEITYFGMTDKLRVQWKFTQVRR